MVVATAEIGARIGPGAPQDRQIHQAQHRHDDRGGQRRLGQEMISGVSAMAASASPTAVKAPAAGVSAPASKFTTDRAKPARHREAPGEGRAEIGGAQPISS
jgi:hypothetical protein